MMISTDFEARKAIIDKLGGNSTTLTSIFQCELVILALYGGDPHNASNIFEADKLILSLLGGDPTTVNTVFEARKAIITRLGGSTIGISNNYEASLTHFELAGGEIPDITYYSVVFKNWDGTVLYTTNVVEGHTPIYNGNIPTRPSDEQYNYTFNGWTPSLGPVYGNIEYTASYTATEIPGEPVYYTVVFKNWDGTVLQTSSVEEGQTAVYNGSTPTRPSDELYDYTFNGWLPSLGPVNENIEYTALYTATAIPEPEPNIYTIKFINWNGDILQTINVEEGQTPVYTGSTPTRPSDELYNYSFNGWTPSIVPATANATYTASYTATAIPVYTIKFINWNGSVLQTMQVKEGDTPVYTGSTPTRPSDDQYDYTFDTWTPSIVPATANATYTALYTATEIPAVNYVTFTAEQSVSKIGLASLGSSHTLEYSTDTQSWSPMTTSTTITLWDIGDKLYVRGIIDGAYSYADYTRFTMTGKIAASGNCNAIWNYQDLNAPLKELCGYSLFSVCTALTQAPELPATTLALMCYYGMFLDCTGLTTAPELPATTLAVGCYYDMFRYCSNLSSIKCLATDISAASALKNWTEDVASSGTFTKAAGVEWPTGTDGIPSGWTVVEV